MKGQINLHCLLHESCQNAICRNQQNEQYEKKTVITPPLPFPPRQKCKLQFAMAAAQVSEITEITLLFL